MDNLVHVKLKRSLKVLGLEKQLVDIITERIHKLPEYQKLRLNNELILLVCNLIENGTYKEIKTNKKETALKVLNEIFSYNNQEHKQVEEAIEFLHSNGKIKRVRLVKKILAYVADWLYRHLH